MKKNLWKARITSLLLALLLLTGAPLASLAQESPAILTGLGIREAEYSLILEGSLDEGLLDQLLPLLDMKQVKTIFFVPALKLAEEPRLAQRILQAGHGLGNYLLKGEHKVQDLDPAQQQRSIGRSQEILSQAMEGTAPRYLKANLSEYTPQLLEFIREAGIPYVLKPGIYLNHSSFKTPEQAAAYVSKLSHGSLISFKINQPLAAEELPEVAPRPTDVYTPEATPGPKEGASVEPTLPVELRILQVLDWLLSALNHRGMRSVAPEDLLLRQGSDFARILHQVQAEDHSQALAEGIAENSPEAFVIQAGFTKYREISLVLEGEASPATLERILELFRARGIHATFFIPGMAALGMPETVQAILSEGHALGNYLLEGERHIEQKDLSQQVKSLHRAQMILRELGATPAVFKGNAALLDAGLLRAVAAVGIGDAVQASHYLNHTSFKSAGEAAGYVARIQPGSIIFIKMNQALDAAEFNRTAAPTASPTASQQPVQDNSDRQTPAPDLGVEDRLLQVVEWLSQALLDSGLATADLMRLKAHQQDPQVQKIARLMADQADDQTLADRKDGAKPAALLRSGPDSLANKHISLVFEGHVSEEGLRQLAALLHQYQVPGTFFLPGEDLLFLADVLEDFPSQGHQLGNYFLAGEKGSRSRSFADNYKSLHTAQLIAQEVTGQAPTLFKANDAPLDEALLKAGAAAGLQAGLVPLDYLNHTSFASQEQAAGYAMNSLPGAILAFKINDSLSEEEAPGTKQGPSPSPEAGAHPSPSPSPSPAPEAGTAALSAEARLLQQVAWLLEAYANRNTVFLQPQQIAQQQLISYPDGFRNSARMRAGEAPDFGDAPQAQVLRAGYSRIKESSLIIEAVNDIQTVAGIAELLNRFQLKATFFLPARLVHEHKDQVRQLVDAGHQLGNYLLGGETAAHRLNPAWLAYNLSLSQAIYQEEAGQLPQLFKGNLTEHSPDLLQVLKAAGIPYALSPNVVLNHTSFRSQEQADGYVSRILPGSLITFKVDQVIDASELPKAVKENTAAPQASPEPEATGLLIPLIVTPKPEAEQEVPDSPALQVAQWLITALFREGFELIPPQQLVQGQESDYAALVQLVEESALPDGLLAALRNPPQAAPVLSAQPVLEKEISLVIEGTARTETYEALLDLLKEHQAKALFFLPAKEALDQGDLVGRILDAGHRVGNYGYQGEARMEELDQEQLAASLYKAQVVLTNLSGQRPELFKGRLTAYTQAVQQVVSAVELKASLLPSIFVNHSSFRDSNQAMAYAQKTPWGSILSLKLNQALDASELPPPTATPQASPDATQAPAATPLPTPVPDTMPEGLDNEGRLLKIAQWLLDSYAKEGFAFVSPEQVQLDKSEALANLQNRTLSPTGQSRPLLTEVRTTDRELSLLLPLPRDAGGVAALAHALRETGVKAVISVNGNDIIAHADSILQLSAEGHQVVSGGFSGRSITGLSYRDATLEIAKNNLLMERKLGFTSAYYAPMLGQAGEELLQAAHDLGITALGYTQRAVPQEEQSPQAVLEDRFRWGVRRGEILSLYLSDYSDKQGLIEAVNKLVEDTGYRLVTARQLTDNTYEFKPLTEIPGWDAVQVNPYYNPQANLLGRYITHLPTTGKTVFLAIDDWGSDKTVTRMLDILAHYNVKATFFVINSRAAKNPNLLRAVAEAGHSIGSHGYDHELMNTLDPAQLQELMVQGYQEVSVALGHAPDLIYQPPQLEMSRESANAVLATGYLSVVGSRLSTHDYKWSADKVQAYVSSNLRYGAILLIHSSDHASANEALPGIIEQVRARGYSFERLIDYLPLTVKDGKVVSK